MPPLSACLKEIKPRVAALAAFTTCVGLWLAPGRPLLTALLALFGAGMSVGASNLLARYFVREEEIAMPRMVYWPVPSPPKGQRGAWWWLGLPLAALAIASLVFVTGVIPAVLLFAAVFVWQVASLRRRR